MCNLRFNSFHNITFSASATINWNWQIVKSCYKTFTPKRNFSKKRNLHLYRVLTTIVDKVQYIILPNKSQYHLCECKDKNKQSWTLWNWCLTIQTIFILYFNCKSRSRSLGHSSVNKTPAISSRVLFYNKRETF